MKTYFQINRRFAANAFKLSIDYDLKAVQDTLALFRPQPTPDGFLEKFRYTIRSGVPEDMLSNSLGWRILSERLAAVLGKSRNKRDIELHFLPQSVRDTHTEIKNYRVLGVKKEVACVDLEKSEILWSGEHISSFRECILKESSIPDDLDIFLMEEYPVVPVISASLALKIAELYPTGFAFEKILAV